MLDADHDPLRASGEAFARELEDAGIVAERHVEPGAWHGFLSRPGTRAFAVLDWGGMAEEAVADAIHVVPIPDGLSLAPAVAMPISYPTAAASLLWRARLEAEVTARAGPAGLTRPRHRAALGEAVDWLDRLAAAPLPELRAEALRGALHALARLTGRVDAEAVLDLVFAEFCVGK